MNRGGNLRKNLKFISHKDKNYQKNTLNKKTYKKTDIFKIFEYILSFYKFIKLYFGKIDVKYKNINSQGEGTVLFKNKN